MTAETTTRRGPYYTLTLLILVYACHFFDRSIIGVVQESVKHEFGLSDSALGAMAGFAYAMSYAAFGIPLGMLIDRVKSRIHLLAGLLAVWSFATAICSAATSATQLVIARVFVARRSPAARPCPWRSSPTFSRRSAAPPPSACSSPAWPWAASSATASGPMSSPTTAGGRRSCWRASPD